MNYYNPKEYVIEDQPSFNPSFNDELLTAHSKDKDAFYRSNNNPLVYANPHTWTQGYGIYKANSLRQKYAAANNIQYDLVVRARFDIAFANAIHLEPNKLQFCGYRPMDGGIDDVFFAGGEKDMNIICDMYNHLYELYSDSDWSNRIKNMGYPVAYYYTSHPIFWNYLTLNSLTDKITYPGWIRDHTFRLIRTNIQRPR
jgi:hypothetical protein